MTDDSEDEDEDEDERYFDENQVHTEPLSQSPPASPPVTPPEVEKEAETPKASSGSNVPPVNIVAPSPISPATGAAHILPPPSPSPKSSLGQKIPRVFKKRPTLPTMSSTDSNASSIATSTASSPIKSRPTTPGTPGTAKKSKFRGKFKKGSEDYNFNAAHDIIGIVMLDIQGATDLPKLRNSMSAGLSLLARF